MTPRVLLVDDDEQMRRSTAQALDLAGFAVEAVGSGEEALTLAGPGFSGAVVSDIRMPDVDGPALYAWVGEQRPELMGRTAFTTGDTLGRHAARFIAEAGRPVLEKPFTFDSVRQFLLAIARA